MFLIQTNIRDVSPIPVVGLVFPSVVVDIAATGIVVHEIVVLFHCI